MQSLNVLVVEDNPEWLEKLKYMYMGLFQGIPISPIETALNKKDALAKLQSRNWDIVSLDINLHGDKTPVGDMTALEDNLAGQDVIQMIAQRKLSRFVIIITSIASDQQIMGLIFDEAGLLQKKLLSLNNELESLFPNRSKYFLKINALDVNHNIISFKERFKNDGTLDLILEACGFLNKLERISKNIWRIVFNGKTLDVKDNKAIHYLAKLFENPGRPISLRELIAPGIQLKGETEGEYNEPPVGSGIKLAELTKDEKESLEGAMSGYRILVERSKSCSENERKELEEEINKAEICLCEVYDFTEDNIDTLRKELKMPEWFIRKHSSQMLDPNKKPRDAVRNAIIRFREDLPESFEDFSQHLDHADVRSSLNYRQGTYIYLPSEYVKWHLCIDYKT